MAQLLALVALAGLLTACPTSERTRPPASAEALVGQPAPALPMEALTEGVSTAFPPEGETVVLAFWATWCGACAQRLASLSGEADTLAAAGVRVIAVNVDNASRSRREDAQQWLRRHRVTLPAAMATGNPMGTWALRHIPMYFVIDCRGNVGRHFTGTTSTDALVAAALRVAAACDPR